MASNELEIQRDRFRGALLGAAIGDALGAPFEGSPAVSGAMIPAHEQGQDLLRYTDDAHMSIALAESLIGCHGFDGEHLAHHFADRYDQEPWRGYGPGPPQVFAALRDGAAWDVPARQLFGGSGSFGNGGAMRVAPAALYAVDDPDAVDRLARQTASVTHAHPLGLEGAALQARALAWLIGCESQPVPEIPALLQALRRAAESEPYLRALDAVERLLPDSPAPQVVAALGNGIEAHRSVPTALYAFLRSPDDFAETVVFAISLGGDTDTIGSMAGALGGAHLGAEAIPASWRRRVEDCDHFVQLADALVSRRGTGEPA